MRIFRQPRDSNMFHEFYNSATKVDELRRLLMSFKQTRNKGECWVRKIYCNCWWYLMFILYFSEKEGKSEKNAWKSHITVDRVGIHKLNCCQLHQSFFLLIYGINQLCFGFSSQFCRYLKGILRKMAYLTHLEIWRPLIWFIYEPLNLAYSKKFPRLFRFV